MNLLNPGVKSIIIYDGVNAFTLSGNDISPQSTLTPSQQPRTRPRGGYLPFLVEFTLELSISDSELFENVSGSRCTFLIEKHNGFYVWGETEILIGEEDILFDPESDEYPFVLRAKHISATPSIGQDGNIIGTFEDSTDSGIADRWESEESDSLASFSGGVQTIEKPLICDVVIPGGSTVVFSVDVVELRDSASDAIEVSSFINGSQSNVEDQAVNSTGINSMTYSVPSGVDYIRLRYFWTSSFGSSVARITNPTLIIQ